MHQKRKNILAILLSLTMTASAAAPAFCAQESTELSDAVTAQTETEAESASPCSGRWETDISLSIRDERQIREESDMSLDAWDDAVTSMKEKGLANPVTEDAILEADPDAQILRSDDGVYFISGNDALGKVENTLDAYRAVYSLLPVLGGNYQVRLMLWSRLTENDMTVYSFQQLSESSIAPGSTIKLAVRADGTVSAVFGSLDPETPGKPETLATREEAEEAVKDHLRITGADEQILPELTDRGSHYPEKMDKALNLDELSDEIVPDEVYWIVYSENQSDEKETRPYIAHYVSLDGTYLYSLPVTEPGSPEAVLGYRIQDIFSGMESSEWTGQVTAVDGSTQTITVPVMKDATTGEYFLGDLSRKVAVADFATAAYGEDHAIELLSSKTGDDWDPEDLFMYYNILRAWDFYASMGWIGPDGQGTETVILKNMCTSDGTLVVNACALGKIEGIMMFAYTANDPDAPVGDSSMSLVQALDVMAHEFTHHFTSTVMNTNLYENDFGAINEAMSDIMGNLCETICKATDDTEWLLGEKTGNAIRSMIKPEDFDQPNYVWDQFYGPHTNSPSDANDRGGVHVNSSLLSKIAASLCTKNGMSQEDAVRFWTTAAMGMTPRAGYPEMSALLNWALETAGLEDYQNALNALIRNEYLDRTEVPDEIPAGQKIVRLALPDNEAFDDRNWAMIGIHLDMNKIESMIPSLGRVAMDLLSNLGDDLDHSHILQILADDLDVDTSKMDLDKVTDDEQFLAALTTILAKADANVLRQLTTWEEADSGEIVMVSSKGPTLYLLMNISQSGTKVNKMLILIGSRWFDLTELAQITSEEDDVASLLENENMIRMMSEMGDELVNMILSPSDEESPKETEAQPETESDDDLITVLEMILKASDYLMTDEAERPPIEQVLTFPAEVEYLPAGGLEDVSLGA